MYPDLILPDALNCGYQLKTKQQQQKKNFSFYINYLFFLFFIFSELTCHNISY